MMFRLFAALALVAAFGGAAPSAQSDLDSFMSQVLARRDENWKKLQQYTLAEDETFSLTGTGGTRIYGFKREYDWFPQDGIFVRSPTRADGVAISDEERRRAEQRWIRQEQERDRQRENDRDDVEPSLNDLIDPEGQPRFVSSAYFMKFKFEPGHYALAGRERLLGRDVLRIEYYPARLFSNDRDREAEREKRRKPDEKPKDNRWDAKMEEMMNKISLVTVWVEPKSYQIVKYTFDNVNFDFLPAAWLVRVNDLKASMTMSQPVKDVKDLWLPRDIDWYFSAMLAIGTFDVRYHLEYHDYRQATTSGRIKGGLER